MSLIKSPIFTAVLLISYLSSPSTASEHQSPQEKEKQVAKETEEATHKVLVSSGVFLELNQSKEAKTASAGVRHHEIELTPKGGTESKFEIGVGAIGRTNETGYKTGAMRIFASGELERRTGTELYAALRLRGSGDYAFNETENYEIALRESRHMGRVSGGVAVELGHQGGSGGNSYRVGVFTEVEASARTKDREYFGYGSTVVLNDERTVLDGRFGSHFQLLLSDLKGSKDQVVYFDSKVGMNKDRKLYGEVETALRSGAITTSLRGKANDPVLGNYAGVNCAWDIFNCRKDKEKMERLLKREAAREREAETRTSY